MNKPKVSLRVDVSEEAKVYAKARAAIESKSQSQFIEELIINHKSKTEQK